MNVHSPTPQSVRVEMSADGEIVVPDTIRRAAGLVPGARVVIGINDRGEAVITTPVRAKRAGESADERGRRIRAAMAALAGRFSTGQATAEVMSELRGDHPA